MSDELASLDATGQAELVARADVTAKELVEAAIARIERLDPRLGAVIHPAFERAREQAVRNVLPDGPFRGVPCLMKDLGGQEAGQPHHAGMRALKEAGWVESVDSYLTRKLRASGLISLGRTNTPELGLLPVSEPEAFGPTRNPWNPAFSAGGSSGGSAAAVAAGMVAVAHASDGGGSIRGPASMCGLVGLKPSRGRNSFGPGLGERWGGFSCEFALTRSVRDTAALLDAVAGRMPGDPYSAPPPARLFVHELGARRSGLRIGLMEEPPRDLAAAPDCAQAARLSARALEALGHRVEPAHPAALDDPAHVAAYVNVVACCTARALDAWGQRIGRKLGAKDVEPLTWALAERGYAASAPDYLAAIETTHQFGRSLAQWWEADGSGFDLLLTPTQAAPPPELGTISSTAEEPLRAFVRAAPYGVFTLPFNLSGQPAISLPVHTSATGLPIGVQLVAAAAREDILIDVAAQLEEAIPWADRRPAL